LDVSAADRHAASSRESATGKCATRTRNKQAD
jgi:hypothetical protein